MLRSEGFSTLRDVAGGVTGIVLCGTAWAASRAHNVQCADVSLLTWVADVSLWM